MRTSAAPVQRAPAPPHRTSYRTAPHQGVHRLMRQFETCLDIEEHFMSIPMESESIESWPKRWRRPRARWKRPSKTAYGGRKIHLSLCLAGRCACRDPGAVERQRAGLTQVLDQWEPGKLMLITTLMHVSGQLFAVSLPPAGGNMQAFGSALTYAKRYSIRRWWALRPMKTTTDKPPARADSARARAIQPALSPPRLAMLGTASHPPATATGTGKGGRPR